MYETDDLPFHTPTNQMNQTQVDDICELSRRAFRNDSLLIGTPYLAYSAFLVYWTFLFFPLTLLLLFITKHRHPTLMLTASYTRIILYDLSCFCFVVVGPIRDLVGYQVFVCDVELWFRVLACFFALSSFSLESMYLSDRVVLAKLLNDTNFQQLQKFVQKENHKPQHHRVSDTNAASQFSSVVPPLPEYANNKNEDVFQAINEDAEKTKLQVERAMRATSTTRRVVLAFVFVVLIPVLYAVSFQVAVPYYGQNCVNCLLEPLHLLVLAVPGLIYCILVLRNLLRLMQRNADGLVRGMVMDMLTLLPLGLTSMGLYCANESIGYPIDKGVFTPDWLFIWAFHHIHMRHVVFVLPPFQCNRKSTAVRNRIEFERVLNDPEALTLFTKHLVGEFAGESIRFYLHVKAFRENYAEFRNPVHCRLAAEEIFWTFVHHGSLLEVNLPESIHKEIARIILSSQLVCPQDMFEKAEKEILNLMESNAFARFTTTRPYLTWLKKGHTGKSNTSPSLAVIPMSSSPRTESEGA